MARRRRRAHPRDRPALRDPGGGPRGATPGRNRRWGSPAAAGALLGLSALTHPQAAVFGVIACVVLSWRAPARPWLVRDGRRRRGGPRRRAPVAGLGLLTTHGLDAARGRRQPRRAGDRAHPHAQPALQRRSVHGRRRPWSAMVGLGRVPLEATVPDAGPARRDVPRRGRRWRVPRRRSWALLAGVGVAMLVEFAHAPVPGECLARARPDRGRWRLACRSPSSWRSSVPSARSSTARRSSIRCRADLIAAMEWLAGQHRADDAVVVVRPTRCGATTTSSEWLPAFARASQRRDRPGIRVARDATDSSRSCAVTATSSAAPAQTAACYADIDPDGADLRPEGRAGRAVLTGRLLPGAARHARGRGLRDRLRRAPAPRSPEREED